MHLAVISQESPASRAARGTNLLKAGLAEVCVIETSARTSRAT